MIELRHLKNNNESYLTHLLFALRAGLYYSLCGVVFIFHAVFPWLLIPRAVNLEGIMKRTRRWNHYTLERLFK